MKKLAILGLGIGVLSAGLYFGANIYGTKVAEAKVNKLIDSMENDNVTVDYKNISFKPLAQDVHLKDITIKAADEPTEISIEKMIIREIDEKSDVPTVFDASVQGLVVDVEQPEQKEMPGFLKQAGYDTGLKFDIDTKYQYDSTKREMNLDTFRISADQVGDLSVNAKLGNVDLKDFDPQKADPTGVPTNLDTIYHGIEITYEDDSFADRLLTAIATEQGIGVDELKAQMTAQLTQVSQFMPEGNKLATHGVNEVVAFIKDPKGFRISMKPEEPMQFQQLMSENPDSWADILNIEIEAF
ncbi:MAG: hypothetical protein AAGD25_26500 [Cyanobacteria bacterium P01_F01_bin.150]